MFRHEIAVIPGIGPVSDLPEQLQYDFAISQFPVSEGQFAAFVESTRHRRQVPYKSVPNNKPVTRVYCTEVSIYCTWLTEQYHRLGLMDRDWRIDLPTGTEFLVGMANLHMAYGFRRSREFSDMGREWCWREYPFSPHSDFDDRRRDDWSYLTNWLAVMWWFPGGPVRRFDITPTWDDDISFRVVMRRDASK